ncbi:MAG: glycosyltransferase [Myxococcota bacterium]|jgi:dolichol-phosphate mannosyltransferase|nr:glycosyltransferase [Myxococcota bacterium]
MKIFIVLPAYNEAENIPPIFDGLRRIARDTYNLELAVVLVDDGSTDDTVEVARNSGDGLALDIVRNESNLGLAATFVRGLEHATRAAGDDDIVVCMDADNTHVPGSVLSMMRNVSEGRDVVIASRYRPGSVTRGVPWFRRLLSRGMSILFRVVYPIPGVRDYSCGYRAYRASILKRLFESEGESLLASDGFSCMVRILLKLHKQGAICGEVPMVLRYDEKAGASKMAVGRTVVRTLSVLLSERLSR